MADDDKMADELASLRIDRSKKGALGSRGPSRGSGESRPGRANWVLPVLLAVALCVAGYFLFLNGRGRVFPDEVEVGAVTLVSPAQEEVTLVATGYVYAKKRATVAPKTTGRLTRLYVDEGDKVKADQIIAELESADSQAQVAQLRADILASQAKVEQQKVALADADTKLVRETALHAKEAGTQASFDDATTRVAQVHAGNQRGAGRSARRACAPGRGRGCRREHQSARAVCRHRFAQIERAG